MLFRYLAATFLLLAGLAACDVRAQGREPINSQKFIELAVTANRYQQQIAELAAEKAVDPAVRNWAEKVLADHKRVGSDLQIVADRAAVDPSRGRFNTTQERVLNDLRNSSGAAFDQAYLKAEREAHTQAAAFYGSYLDTGKDPNLTELAETILPVVRWHMQHLVALPVR